MEWKAPSLTPKYWTAFVKKKKHEHFKSLPRKTQDLLKTSSSWDPDWAGGGDFGRLTLIAKSRSTS
jgi:hypothetical protein